MLKKLTTLLIIASSFLMMLNAAEKYAVLITGDYAAKDIPEEALWQTNSADKSLPMQEFWNDTYLMWEMLIERGYDEKNIIVLFADGQDFYIDNEWVDDRYRPVHAGFSDTYTITKGDASAATITNVENVALELQGKLTEDDFLFVWTFDHGSYYSSTGSKLCLLDGDMTDTHFASYFNPIQANKKVYWMQQCFSGGFADNLQADNTFFVSAVGMWTANRADDLTNTFVEIPGRENEWINGNQYMHGEFNFHMYSATTGSSPANSEFYYYDVEFSDADINNDGIITVSEAAKWEKDQESEEDSPVEEDIGNIGYHTTLKYPTIFLSTFTNEVTDFYTNTTFRGIIGIPGYADIWGVPRVVIQPNSTLEIAEEGEFFQWNEEGMDFGNNCIIKGEGSSRKNFNVWGSEISLRNCHVDNINLYGLTDQDFPEYNSTINLYGINEFNNTLLELSGLSRIVLNENALLRITPDYIFNMQPNSTLKLRDNSVLDVTPITSFTMQPGTNVSVMGDATIQGDFSTSAGSTIIVGINSKLRIGANSKLTIDPASYVKLEQGAELIVEDGAVCTLPAGASITTTAGSKITVFGTFSSNGTFEYKSNIAEDEPDKGGTWQGIKAEVGSEIYLTYTNLSYAETALSGTPAVCNVVYSEFAECTNGIELINCNNYNIFNNEFTGSNEGIGISLSLSNGYLIDNVVQSYSNGIAILSGAPYLSDNTIRNNDHYGLYVTGYNTYPQLIEPATSGKNNEIYNNGLNNIEDGGQIYLKYSASVYLNNGRNNIYSEPLNQVPVVPCIKGVSHLTSKLILPWVKGIPAENNYWGSYRVYEEYFDLYERYRLDFDPYSETKFIDENGNIIPFGTLTFEEKLLSKAVEFELDGKLDQAVKKLETIVSKEEELEISLRSEEYYLAVSKLPDLYVRQSMELEPLIKLYDTNLSSEDESVNKKFFKEMKVATHIKGKKYDDAIAIAEEMKAEAETEGEVMLAEFDIAVARMMKEAENSGKGRNESTTTDISALLDKLTGVEDKGNPAGITDAEIPKTATLYQNYPNPFNPVTQIKFALAKTAEVKLSVYNIAGQLVSQLASGVRQVGVHSVDFDGSKLNSGVYYYTLEVDGKAMTKKMVLTK